jgi:hypothetical protein
VVGIASKIMRMYTGLLQTTENGRNGGISLPIDSGVSLLKKVLVKESYYFHANNRFSAVWRE